MPKGERIGGLSTQCGTASTNVVLAYGLSVINSWFSEVDGLSLVAFRRVREGPLLSSSKKQSSASPFAMIGSMGRLFSSSSFSVEACRCSSSLGSTKGFPLLGPQFEANESNYLNISIKFNVSTQTAKFLCYMSAVLHSVGPVVQHGLLHAAFALPHTSDVALQVALYALHCVAQQLHVTLLVECRAV